MSDTASIYTTLSFNGFVFMLIMLVFEFVRTRELDIYAPRSRGKKPTAPKPRSGIFQWFSQVYAVSDDDMLRFAGMDGYVMMRFLLFCTKLCTICGVGACVLMPVYYYAAGDDDVTGIDKLSMANIELKGVRLWASLAFMYLFSFIFLYLIHKEYGNFMSARNKFFLGFDEDIPTQMNFSIQVENIPPGFRSSGKLKAFFENIFPQEVLFATVEVAMPALDEAVAQRNELVGQVEDAVAEYESGDKDKRPMLHLLKGKPAPQAYAAVCQEEDQQVDKIEFLSDQLSLICAEVAALQKTALAATEDSEAQELSSMASIASERDDGRRAAGRGENRGTPSPMTSEQSVHRSSISTTSTLDSSLGIHASSPMHVVAAASASNNAANAAARKQAVMFAIPGGHKYTTTAIVDAANADLPPTAQIHPHGAHTSHSANADNNASEDRPASPASLLSADSISALSKQSTAATLKAANAGLDASRKATMQAAKASLGVSMKVATFITDIKDNIANNLASATGFVTFKTRRAQVSAAQVPVISQQYPKVTAAPAPAPSDIIWENMSASPEHTENVAYATASFYYTGLLFWGAILASVAALSDLSTLQKYLPFLSVLGSLARSILQGLLPVFVVILFSIVLHMVMDFIARKIEKRKTHSSVQQEIFKWYFMYQIANVYLLLLAGSIFDSLESAINDPASIITLISQSLPSVSVFFINFIITTWLGGVPLILLQAAPTGTLAFYRMCFNPMRVTRPMLKNGPFAPYEVEYGTALPDLLYVLCIVLLYWVIAPVILIFAAMFFFSSYMAYKYQFIFVTIRSYESGGQFFYGLYAYSMTGLLAASVLFMAYMGIKEGALQAPLMAPLPCIIIYCWRYTEKEYKVMSLNMPFDTAVKEDEGHANTNAAAHQALLDSFQVEFLKQPNITGPALVYPYPHRIDDIPLLDSYGSLNDVYVEDIPEGMDPSVYIQQLRSRSYQSPAGEVPSSTNHMLLRDLEHGGGEAAGKHTVSAMHNVAGTASNGTK